MPIIQFALTTLLWLLCLSCSDNIAERIVEDVAIISTLLAYTHKLTLSYKVLYDLLPLAGVGLFILTCLLSCYVFHGWWTLQHNPPTSTTPVFYNCKTLHKRLIPKKHSFEYPYLLVGVPISYEGNLGFLLSVQHTSGGKPPPWCAFSVRSIDYLRRGEGTLREKLGEYLEENVCSRW